jgi:hypothetical protein
MWDALPIQRANNKTGPHYSTIHPDFPYPAYTDVCVSRWRDVDAPTQKWAMSIWCIHFGIRRCPVGPDDLFLWIPYVSTLVAKLGRWNDTLDMALVQCNYVDPARRGEGLAQKMILTMANKLSPRKFIFELQNVPRSLADATPFLRFSYVWIPALFDAKYVETTIDARGIPGFHPDSWAGYRMFRSGEARVLLDPHDDIVWHSAGLWSLLGFSENCSRYVRWFSPYGNIRAYAQNMYFTLPEYSASVNL